MSEKCSYEEVLVLHMSGFSNFSIINASNIFSLIYVFMYAQDVIQGQF